MATALPWTVFLEQILVAAVSTGHKSQVQGRSALIIFRHVSETKHKWQTPHSTLALFYSRQRHFCELIKLSLWNQEYVLSRRKFEAQRIPFAYSKHNGITNTTKCQTLKLKLSLT
jgi:hypothetical protein